MKAAGSAARAIRATVIVRQPRAPNKMPTLARLSPVIDPPDAFISFFAITPNTIAGMPLAAPQQNGERSPKMSADVECWLNRGAGGRGGMAGPGLYGLGGDAPTGGMPMGAVAHGAWSHPMGVSIACP